MIRKALTKAIVVSFAIGFASVVYSDIIYKVPSAGMYCQKIRVTPEYFDMNFGCGTIGEFLNDYTKINNSVVLEKRKHQFNDNVLINRLFVNDNNWYKEKTAEIVVFHFQGFGNFLHNTSNDLTIKSSLDLAEKTTTNIPEPDVLSLIIFAIIGMIILYNKDKIIGEKTKDYGGKVFFE